MTRTKIRVVCPHRFLIVTGIDHRRSVEMSRCYHCWNAGDPPSHNTLFHMVFVPAKETPSDTQTHPTPETDAIHRTSAAAGCLVSLACVIDAGMLDQDRGDEGVVSGAIRAEEIVQPWRFHVELFDQATGGPLPLPVFSSRTPPQDCRL